MKIRKMTASFGALEKAVLIPGDGLTLIQAQNEAGKSTWCAFLRAMLYGFPTRDRDRAGYLAEKNRYQPWSGAAMEGTIELEWKGREVTLYRGPKGTAAWGAFSAVYTATGEAVPGLTAENCGETLLGISREVFERTAFVGQGEISLSPSGDLEKRVATLATSGEEDVSFSQVERRLKDWLNRRKVNSRVGLIPELEHQLEQVETAAARQGELLRQAQAALQEQEALQAQKAQLQTRLQAHAAASAAQQGQRRQQAQADYDAALDALQTAQAAAGYLPSTEELRRAQGDLAYLNTLEANLRMAEKAIPEAREAAEEARKAAQSDPCFSGWDAAQAAAKAQADHDQAVALQKKGASLLSLLGAPVGCILGFALGRTAQGRPYSLPMLILGAILGWAVVALPMFLMGRGKKKRLSTLMERYQAQTPEDILTRGTEYSRKMTALQEAERQLQATQTERDKLAGQKEELTGQLLNFVRPFAPQVSDPFGVSAALSRALQQGETYRLAQARLEAAERLLTALPSPQGTAAAVSAVPVQGDAGELAARLQTVNGALERAAASAARLQGELSSQGDPAELEERRGQLMEALEQRRREYDAIAAALESLKNADSLLRERFSPAVNAKAGAFLSALTGGKYDKAALTRQFQALAQERDGAAHRQDLSLSVGAAEQLYLAMRLAMCELVLPAGEPCPILLDDALDAFDDTRAAYALDCLLDLAEKRQVLLFTCHSREAGLLRGRDVSLASL
ncbi:ATP-binding protein [Vermiculatibacterium agrestimuris]|uniref:ATP-binding protein n=1 Tax=Vermiculatibacterium agrestimuris TaxID=2941519 RepID=UPI00203FBEF7|nr:AAA family ATPase [Vermiculatibacterium agrestimuris]